MRRAKNLFPQITAFSNLVSAFQNAQKGKKYHGVVPTFRLNLEKELVGIQDGLLNGSYKFGDYHVFHIHEPKPRLISAAPFRDRVVHHALAPGKKNPLAI